MSEWQPWSTVPQKHAGRVLACDRYGQMRVVFWIEPTNTLDPEDYTQGWHMDDGKNDPIWWRTQHEAVAWMPLPAPPQEPRDE